MIYWLKDSIRVKVLKESAANKNFPKYFLKIIIIE